MRPITTGRLQAGHLSNISPYITSTPALPVQRPVADLSLNTAGHECTFIFSAVPIDENYFTFISKI